MDNSKPLTEQNFRVSSYNPDFDLRTLADSYGLTPQELADLRAKLALVGISQCHNPDQVRRGIIDAACRQRRSNLSHNRGTAQRDVEILMLSADNKINSFYKLLRDNDHSFWQEYNRVYNSVTDTRPLPSEPYRSVDQMLSIYEIVRNNRSILGKVFNAVFQSAESRKSIIKTARKLEQKWIEKATLIQQNIAAERARREANEIEKQRRRLAKEKKAKEERDFLASVLNGISSVDEYMSKAKDGLDYEQRMCQLIMACGCKCQKAKDGADQGVDLIVDSDKGRLAIQCKFYTHPVGNQAVQAVVCGKAIYKCSHACVVSNSTYTPAAELAAKANKVRLLSHAKLFDYLKQFKSQIRT